MAILIDPPLWPAHGRLWSHLVSDRSFEELHAFARAHGVAPRGFEGDHYDVPQDRYTAMVAAGARPVAGRELLERLRRAGLRRPKRRGERVIASHEAGDGTRIDVLTSTLTPARPVRAVWALVVGAPAGVLAVPHGAGWTLPRVDLTPGAAPHSWAELAAALAGSLSPAARAHPSNWFQVGYLRRQPLPAPAGLPGVPVGLPGVPVGTADARAPGVDVELVLRTDAVPAPDHERGAACPPVRWVSAADVARTSPPLGALLDVVLDPRSLEFG